MWQRYFKLFRELFEIAGAVVIYIVMIRGDRDGVPQAGIAHHVVAERADTDLIGDDHLDIEQ
jgi:hypothetical protein